MSPYPRRDDLLPGALVSAVGYEPVVDVATRLGYADQAHLTRESPRWPGVRRRSG